MLIKSIEQCFGPNAYDHIRLSDDIQYNSAPSPVIMLHWNCR